MNRKLISTLTMLLLVFSASQVYAQRKTYPIKFDEKPAPSVGPDEVVVYVWWSTWGLRDDPPNKFTQGPATHKSKAEAVAAAQKHIDETAGNGSLAVTHYLIEGEPSVRKKSAVRVEKAKELLDQVAEAKKAVDKIKKVANGEEPLLKTSERKLGDTIKEYKDMVAKSYQQAVEVKKTMTGGVASLTDAKFRQVNGLIDQYNREVQDFESVMGKEADLGFSPLTRIQPSDPKKNDSNAKEYWISHRGLYPHTGKPPDEWRDDFEGPYTLEQVREYQKFNGGSTWSTKDSSGKVVDEYRFVRIVDGKTQLVK